MKRAAPGRTGVMLGVLPLQNANGGEDVNDLGQGFAEDVLAALSCFQDISVISSASILQLGREEGTTRRMAELDFLLDGSMRYSDATARVTLRLVDLREDNRIIWTNHFDLERQNRFDLQDEIAARVAAQLQLAIERVESIRASMATQEDSTAYDLVLYAIPLTNRLIRQDFDLAEALLRRAVALQPDYVPAQTHLAWHLLLRVAQGWSDNDAALMVEAAQLAERAILMDPGYARAFAIAGHIRAFISRRPREALALHARALSLNPNMAMAWGLAAFTYTFLGELDEAELRFERYSRLAPNDPSAFFWESGRIILHLQRRTYEAAIESGRRMNAMNPNLTLGLQHYLAALGHAELMDEAKRIRSQLLDLVPQLTLEIAGRRCAMEIPGERDHYVEGLRKAGLS